MQTDKKIYVIDIPKILCLALKVSKYAKNQKYFNTQDLMKFSHQYKNELVRLRKDKNSREYKYLEDTSEGGLRGNFSTLVTFCGLVKINNRLKEYYSIGPGERLINAFNNGEIIVNNEEFTATTKNEELAKILASEAKRFNLKESQAHIAAFLSRNPNFPLKRDNSNFKKLCVLKSDSNQYFYRIIVNRINNFKIEYNLFSYLSGDKLKKQNIHALFVVPKDNNFWAEFHVINAKEILNRISLFVYYNLNKKVFEDSNGKPYKSEKLNDALKHISNENSNVTERLNYDWIKIKDRFVEKEISESRERKETEVSVFIKNFLSGNLNNSLEIYDKKVKEYKIHEAGVDVKLEFTDGTNQNLELEHSWIHYIQHGHHNNAAWKNAWVFANQKFDFEIIKQIYLPHKGKFIPKVFLSHNPSNNKNEAYEVDWENIKYKKLSIRFN